jgi:hypothetical protein
MDSGAEHVLLAHPTLPDRLTVGYSGITHIRETHTMETTIKKRVEIKGWGSFDGEFIQDEDGWFCREVNGIRWKPREWGTQAAMDTPEEAALYLLSLNIDDAES